MILSMRLLRCGIAMGAGLEERTGRSGQSEIGESRNVVVGRGLRKTTENDPPDAARRRGEFGRHRADSDTCGTVGGKP